MRARFVCTRFSWCQCNGDWIKNVIFCACLATKLLKSPTNCLWGGAIFIQQLAEGQSWTVFYTLEWVLSREGRDINFFRFMLRFSNNCGYRATTGIRIRRVFKSFHSGERFLKFRFAFCQFYVFSGYVRTVSVTTTKYLRTQTNPDTCRLGFKIIGMTLPIRETLHSNSSIYVTHACYHSNSDELFQAVEEFSSSCCTLLLFKPWKISIWFC